ncbi:MAG: MptD family putative ECF transporter S component [Lachnospiraceae bacterium]|nr:MptD family putative ECF transporter S component [Lachnospiraceae bacterium]
MKTKLTTKDLITAGAFGAIYLVLLTVLSSILTIVPVLFLATPLIAGIVLGTVYMLYATKVPRTGAILVLAVLVGLITSMSTIYPLIFAVVWGIIAEIITAKKHKSAGALAASYCVFNLTSMGPFFALVLAKDAFLESCSDYYGAEYVATLDALTPGWIVVVLIALALVGGLLGGLFGKRVLKKHFVKAGITE